MIIDAMDVTTILSQDELSRGDDIVGVKNTSSWSRHYVVLKTKENLHRKNKSQLVKTLGDPQKNRKKRC